MNQKPREPLTAPAEQPDQQSPREPEASFEFPMLDAADATRMLDSIFEESGVEPNTVPMEALTAYSGVRRERKRLQRTLIAIAVVIVLLLPLLFVAPEFDVTVEPAGENALPVYTVRTAPVLPVRQVMAVMGQTALPVTEEDGRTYTVEPPYNGDMTLSVTYFNRKKVTRQVQVREVDEEEPEALSVNTDGEFVHILLRDAGVGIDYEGIFAVSESGETIRPESFDEAAGEIVLRYPEEPCDLFVPDRIGNTLHLRLSFR